MRARILPVIVTISEVCNWFWTARFQSPWWIKITISTVTQLLSLDEGSRSCPRSSTAPFPHFRLIRNSIFYAPFYHSLNRFVKSVFYTKWQLLFTRHSSLSMGQSSTRNPLRSIEIDQRSTNDPNYQPSIVIIVNISKLVLSRRESGICEWKGELTIYLHARTNARRQNPPIRLACSHSLFAKNHCV